MVRTGTAAGSGIKASNSIVAASRLCCAKWFGELEELIEKFRDIVESIQTSGVERMELDKARIALIFRPVYCAGQSGVPGPDYRALSDHGPDLEEISKLGQIASSR